MKINLNLQKKYFENEGEFKSEYMSLAKSLCQLFSYTYNERGRNVKNDTENKDNTMDLRCPECRALLRRRRARTPDKCEMVCGGCGQSFDVCNFETLEELKKQS